MSKVLRGSAAAFCSLMAGLGTAAAATVSPLAGEVLVNHGSGFKAASAPIEVLPGGQVMVRPGGSAAVSYGNGCTIKVDAGRIWSIQDKPPCEGDRAIDLTARMNGGSLKDSPEPVADHRWLVVPLIGGGIVACAILCNDNDPSSP
jgi:hypothetical protein